MRQVKFRRDTTILLLGCISCTSAALAQASVTSQSQIQDTGISGLWILANISFAGMRAQNNRSVFWRTLAFVVGLPGTIVTFFVVPEGSDHAYGVDLPRRGKS
jgi:peptidoglycan/LPS O-acetylase OafA/YrhL